MNINITNTPHSRSRSSWKARAKIFSLFIKNSLHVTSIVYTMNVIKTYGHCFIWLTIDKSDWARKEFSFSDRLLFGATEKLITMKEMWRFPDEIYLFFIYKTVNKKFHSWFFFLYHEINIVFSSSTKIIKKNKEFFIGATWDILKIDPWLFLVTINNYFALNLE